MRVLGLSKDEAEALVKDAEKVNASSDVLLKTANDVLAQKVADKKAAVAAAGITWKIQETDDKMGRGQIKSATIRSLNEHSFRSPYDGVQRMQLMLRVHPRYGKGIILSIPRGQFTCRMQNCAVLVRFGENKPQKFTYLESSDGSADVIFLRGYSIFLSNVKKSDKISIEAEFYQEGHRVFDFDTTSLVW